MTKFNIINRLHDNISYALSIDGIEVKLYDGEKIFQRYGKYYSVIDGDVRQIQKDFYNYLWGRLSNFDYWETEDGRILELNQMSASHLSATIQHLDRNKINPNNIIEKMKTVLRDKNIDNVLNDPTEKNYGLDIE